MSPSYTMTDQETFLVQLVVVMVMTRGSIMFKYHKMQCRKFLDSDLSVLQNM